MMTRRKFLGTSAAAVGAAALAACGAAPTATLVPPTQTPVIVSKEVTKVVVQTQVVKETQVVQQTQIVEKIVTATPVAVPTLATAKVTGVFQMVQKQDYFPNMNLWLRNELAKYFTAQGWSWDIAYAEGYAGGTPFVDKMAASSAAGTPPDLMMNDQSFTDLYRLKVVDPIDDIVSYATSLWGDPSARQ